MDCFNPRAPRGARRSPGVGTPLLQCFNPRAPRGARQPPRRPPAAQERVSIHAPRAGRDTKRKEKGHEHYSFNPRAPRGARLKGCTCTMPGSQFQSTRPARGATAPRLHRPQRLRFQSTRPARGATDAPPASRPRLGVSIHAPRAGRDGRKSRTYGISTRFNPRAPRGARRSS